MISKQFQPNQHIYSLTPRAGHVAVPEGNKDSATENCSDCPFWVLSVVLFYSYFFPQK